MPGFLTDVVRPPGNPGMDANWKRRRSGRVPIGEGLVAGSRAVFSKIGDAVTVAVEAGRQLHTYSPRATLRLWRGGCEVSTSALQGCGGLGVVLPGEPGAQSAGLGEAGCHHCRRWPWIYGHGHWRMRSVESFR